MKHITRFGVALLAVSASAAMAVDYDYVELGYHNVFTNTKFDPTGANLVVSTGIGENGYFFVDYKDLDEEIGGITTDIARAEIGLGYRTSVTEATDFNFAVIYVREKTDVMGVSNLGEGYAWRAGYRIDADEYWEFEPFLGYERTEEADGLRYGLQGTVKLADALKAYLRLEKGTEDFNTQNVTIGVRYNF